MGEVTESAGGRPQRTGREGVPKEAAVAAGEREEASGWGTGVDGHPVLCRGEGRRKREQRPLGV